MYLHPAEVVVLVFFFRTPSSNLQTLYTLEYQCLQSGSLNYLDVVLKLLTHEMTGHKWYYELCSTVLLMFLLQGRQRLQVLPPVQTW